MIDELQSLTEFKSSPKIKEELLKIGTIKTFKEGDVILNENAYIKAIPLVLSGSIKVIRTDDEGREILIYNIASGESCIMSFLGSMHHETSKIKAIVEEPTELLIVPVDKLNVLIRDYPEWLNYIFKLYHKRFEELLELVNAIAFKKVDERLWDLLIVKSNHTKSKSINITHEQLSNDLGTARVVVSRLLKQMEEKGMVKLGRNNILIV